MISFPGPVLRAILGNLPLVVLLFTASLRAQVQFQPYEVHVGYVIPSNRQAQPNAISDLQALFPAIQGWHFNQIDHYIVGCKTFQFDTLPDAVTPKVWSRTAAITDTLTRQVHFNNTLLISTFISRTTNHTR